MRQTSTFSIFFPIGASKKRAHPHNSSMINKGIIQTKTRSTPSPYACPWIAAMPISRQNLRRRKAEETRKTEWNKNEEQQFGDQWRFGSSWDGDLHQTIQEERISRPRHNYREMIQNPHEMQQEGNPAALQPDMGERVTTIILPFLKETNSHPIETPIVL